MKAVVDGHTIADSENVVENDGYQYFPASAVSMECLEKTPKTASDLECPHVVQFYDVVVNGKRHPRNAWVYESPRPAKRQIKDLVGFWKDVKFV